MMETSYFSLSSNLRMIYAEPDRPYARTGNRHGGLSLCPYNVYQAKDGYIAIIVNHDEHWQSLLVAVSQQSYADDPRYRTNRDRVSRMEEVDTLVGDWVSEMPREELFNRLIAHRVPSAPVRELAEVMDDAHLHARGALRWVDHPEYGRLAAAASPLRFYGKASLPERFSAPLGADSRAVLQERLDLTTAELDGLESSGVI